MWLSCLFIEKTKDHKCCEDRGRVPATTTQILASRACTIPKTTKVSIPKATSVSHFAPTRLQKQRVSCVSRLHDSKRDEFVVFRACTTPKTTITTKSRILPLHDSKTDESLALLHLHVSKSDESLAFRACTNPKATKVWHFPPALF